MLPSPLPSSHLIQLHLKPAAACMCAYVPCMASAVILAEAAVKDAVAARLAAAAGRGPVPLPGGATAAVSKV